MSNNLPAAVADFELHFTLNGTPQTQQVPIERTVADLLRDELRLTGTHIGCSRGVCGACTVLVDGLPAASCSLFAFQLQGCTVQTIEGVAQGAQLHPLQQAFIDQGAFQC
ncbi:MAG: 2Fe-2S iron-sulfur cluster-binding protein, partial [Burkholderiaceae bacterium]